MGQTIPKIWAHRGASGYAPENTIEAFERAVEMKADGVELDVQLTKDGQMVVIHDETVDRVSGINGFVRDYTLQELRKLDTRTPVIASSKFDRGEEDEEKLFELGFDGYLWYNTNLNEGAYGYIEYLRAMKNYFHYKQKYNWQR